jgi:uncharacterized membrane protein YdbT with pleckstrin-like domain
MSYIDDTLLKNETVLYRSKPHWIIFALPVVWLIISILLFIFGPSLIGANYPVINLLPIYAIAALIALILAVITAIISYVSYQTSEYGITNKRVLMKVGFIRRLSLEIYLQRIESVKVYQSVLGRILGYGSITISGVGGSRDPFSNIPNPLEFRRRVQERVESFAEGKGELVK